MFSLHFLFSLLLLTPTLLSSKRYEQLVIKDLAQPFTLTPPEDSPESLSDWARDTKKKFLAELTENRAEEWAVVMGNEAGDTDSLAAAIAWAFHVSHLKAHPQKAIALLQTVGDALDLRPENQLALNRSQMAPKHRDLLTFDELPIKPFELSLHLRGIVLVDHNVPTPGWERAPVLSIIDHHLDQHKHQNASPRWIQKSASCSSLVTKLILDSEDAGEHQFFKKKETGIPYELVDLLLRAIALDSGGLDRDRSEQVDVESTYRLFRLSQWYDPLLYKDPVKGWERRAVRALMRNFSDEMTLARGHLEALDLRDLLRRDWKYNAVWTSEPRYPILTIGFGSIPYSLETQIDRTPEKTPPEWFAIERAFTSEMLADMSIVLTNYHSVVTGKNERQLVVVVAHGWGKRLTSAAATSLFEAICVAIEAGLEELVPWARPDGIPLLPRRMAWKIKHQAGSHVGRKMVMPLVQDAVSKWKWDDQALARLDSGLTTNPKQAL